MLCFIALILFAIFGVFSVSYRKLAVEAFDCVFRKVTLRKCQTRLDERIKGKIVGRVMRRSPKLAVFLHKNMEVFSWVLLILTVFMLYGLIVGGYNYYLYGNCNGPNEDGFCVFDPTGSHTGTSTLVDSCGDPVLMKASLNINKFDESLFPKIDKGSKVTLIEIGCYECEYTQKAQPVIEKLLDNYDLNFVFAHVPVNMEMGPHHEIDCLYKQDTGLFWEAHGQLFSTVVNARSLVPDKEMYDECVSSNETHPHMLKQIENIKTTNIYGTPTVFIKGPKTTEVVVGPKPYRVYSRLVKKAIKE